MIKGEVAMKSSATPSAVRRFLPLCALLLLFSFAVPTLAQEGYFHVEVRNGVWWIIDPQGNPVLSSGVDHISYKADRIQGTARYPYAEAIDQIYPDRNAWGLEALVRIRQWGLNTIGAWSDTELWVHGVPYTVMLSFAGSARDDWGRGMPEDVVDVYDARFEKTARDIAKRLCQPRRFDHTLLGYFSDNELRWGPDWRGKETILDLYLKLPADAAGHQRAVNFLRMKYAQDIHKLNQAWGVSVTNFESVLGAGATETYRSDADEFVENVATRYFEVSEKAIHEADPNHLYLGARFAFAGNPSDGALRGARKVDVVSINVYEFDPRSAVQAAFKLTGRPVLIGEFAFRAEDSGLPNTHGAGPKVADQAARAQAYADYVNRLESLPEAVGYHWFEWVDEPKEGRFEGDDVQGENSNYGLVDIQDHPYQEFVEGVKKANMAAVEVHKALAPLKVGAGY
jgi:agarase